MLTIKNYKILVYQTFTTNNSTIEWVIDKINETDDTYEIFVSQALNKINNQLVFAISRDKFDESDKLEYGVVVYKDKKIIHTDEITHEDIDSRVGMLMQLQTITEGIKIFKLC